MRLNAVKILKISVTNSSKKTILEEIQKYLDKAGKNNQKPLKIYTPNTEQLVFATKNPSFASVLNRADLTIPDAIGVVWAGRILTNDSPKNRIAGVDLMEELAKIAENRHVPIGLIGGRSSLAVETFNCLQKKYPVLTGWGMDGPEITIWNQVDERDLDAFAKRIKDTRTQIVFVALGPPKQEYYIEALSRVLKSTSVILMAVGGSFDIISGRLPRAPLFLRTLGLEWFWRLILEPRRIIRQLALFEFVWLVLREKLSGRPS